MKRLSKKYRNNFSPFLYTTVLLGLILNSCSISKNLCRKTEPSIIPRPVSVPPLSESLAHLSINARISIQSERGNVTLSAEIEYRGMDTVSIQLKDPLRRQLANLTISNNEYNLWLQREDRFISGIELPSAVGDFQVPPVPVRSIAQLLIGQTDHLPKNDSLLTLKTDKNRLPVQVTIGNENAFIVSFSDWKIAEKYYAYPTELNIVTSQGMTIIIQYSQFQLELRKLS